MTEAFEVFADLRQSSFRRGRLAQRKGLKTEADPVCKKKPSGYSDQGYCED